MDVLDIEILSKVDFHEATASFYVCSSRIGCTKEK